MIDSMERFWIVVTDIVVMIYIWQKTDELDVVVFSLIIQALAFLVHQARMAYNGKKTASGEPPS